MRAADIVACAEVLSAGKLPLYFLRAHKSNMWAELMDLVEFYLGEMYPWENPSNHPLMHYLTVLHHSFLGGSMLPSGTGLARLNHYLDSLPSFVNVPTFDRMRFDWRRITNRIRAEWNGKYALFHVVKDLFFKSRTWAAEYVAEQEALLASFQTAGENTEAAVARFESFLNRKKC